MADPPRALPRPLPSPKGNSRRHGHSAAPRSRLACPPGETETRAGVLSCWRRHSAQAEPDARKAANQSSQIGPAVGGPPSLASGQTTFTVSDVQRIRPIQFSVPRAELHGLAFNSSLGPRRETFPPLSRAAWQIHVRDVLFEVGTSAGVAPSPRPARAAFSPRMQLSAAFSSLISKARLGGPAQTAE